MPDKILGAILLMAWVSLFFADTVAKKIGDMWVSEPWFSVELSIENDTIYYSRNIRRWLHGRWTAEVQRKNALWPNGWEGVCNASGKFTYKPERSGTVSMSYNYFFDGDCVRPLYPHRICAAYTLTDLNDRTRPFGPFCSREVFN